ncbi:MAG: hypothetical protein QXO03_05200 [Thermoplasmatales archaeon]
MNLQVTISTSIIFVLSVVLATLLTQNAVKKRGLSYAFWSVGMWLFSIGVALEIAFSAGVFNSVLIDGYTLIVAMLVGFLALGSMSLTHRKTTFRLYALYFAFSTAFLVVSLTITHIGNIIVGGVVYGALPLLVVISSSVVTFPAAVILIVVSLVSYRRSRDWKLLSIVAGVIVVSIAGTLYVAAFPSFLYIAEFIGILLLWIGFVDFRYISNSRGVSNKDVISNVR